MIYGEKVYLRPFTRADLPIFERWANDISHNSEFNTFGLVRSDALEAGFNQGGLLDSRQGMRVVAAKHDDAVVGDVSYHQVRYGPNEGSVAYNMGITIATAHRGKGYGAEAQQLS